MLTLKSNELKTILDMGYKVFPVHYAVKNNQEKLICSCNDGITCKENNKGKHPMINNFSKEATNDYGEFCDFGFEKFNLGLPTGKVNDIEVIDVDKDHGGFESLKKIMKKFDLHTPLAVKTGGGGLHLYYQYSDKNLKNYVGILPGIDIRTDGAYVLAPGSIHRSGNYYEVLEKFNIDEYIGRQNEN